MTAMFTSCILSLTLGMGCDTASDESQKIVIAESAASEKIAAAAKEADQKIKNAQVIADAKIAQAQSNFMKMRADYREETAANLVDLDRKLAVPEAKLKLARGKVKVDLAAKLTRIRASRADFTKDYEALEAESIGTWDNSKARLSQKWAQLKDLAGKV